MPFCGKCGTELSEGMAFCGKCGNPIAPESGKEPPPGPPPPPVEDNAAPPPPPPPPQAEAKAAPPPPQSQASGNALSSNIAALLAYILGFITGIIFLVLEPYKNDKFVRFHAFQSIFYHGALIVFWILWSIIIMPIFVRIPFLGLFIGLIGSLIFLAAFLFWLFLMYKAYNNERFMIPVIGEMAAKQAGE